MTTVSGDVIELLTTANSTGPVFLPRPVNIPGLISLCVFYLVILGLGVWASWRNKTWKSNDTAKIMLAGRSVGNIVGTFTVTATWVGGGMINGTSEGIFTPGLGVTWTIFMWAAPLCLLVNGLFFAKKMRSACYVTILDPFRQKYGLLVAGLVYIPSLCGDLFYTGAILSALGASLAVILGISHETGVAVSAGIATLYTMLGGLYSVIFTDVFQIFCMFFGLWLSAGFSMANPLAENMWSGALGANGWVGVLEPDRMVMTWIDIALLIVLGGLPWQGYYQRVLSAKTPRIAVNLSIAGFIGSLILILPAIFIGAVACTADWSQTGYGLYFPLPIEAKHYPLILPLVLEFLTPLPVAVIGLGAISAAVMSSADSSFFASASMFARHVYAPIRNRANPEKQASEREIIWVMRGSVLFIGVLAAVTAITIRSIHDLYVLCADIVYVIVFPLFVCVVHLESTNTYGALAGYISSFVLRLMSGEPVLAIPALIKFPYYDEANQVQIFPYRSFIVLVTFMNILGVSLVTRLVFTTGLVHPRYDFMEVFKGQLFVETNENPEECQNNETSI